MKILLAALLTVASLSAHSNPINNLQAADAACKSAFPESKVWDVFYTGKPSAKAIGIVCKLSPYKNTQIEISRSQLDEYTKDQ